MWVLWLGISSHLSICLSNVWSYHVLSAQLIVGLHRVFSCHLWPQWKQNLTLLSAARRWTRNQANEDEREKNTQRWKPKFDLVTSSWSLVVFCFLFHPSSGFGRGSWECSILHHKRWTISAAFPRGRVDHVMFGVPGRLHVLGGRAESRLTSPQALPTESWAAKMDENWRNSVKWVKHGHHSPGNCGHDLTSVNCAMSKQPWPTCS